MITKICKTCQIKKTSDLFNIRKESGKPRAECKACQAKYHEQYRIKNKTQIKKKFKTKYAVTAEERKAKAREFYKKNSEYIKARSKKYYANNKEKARTSQRNYTKDRRKTDPLYRSIRNLRNRMYYALQNKNWKKDTNFSKYIGLNSYEELKFYLESRFQEGMTWENYGLVWEIDHIYPLSLAQTQEELYNLSCYNNLQPLWKNENRTKSNKVPK